MVKASGTGQSDDPGAQCWPPIGRSALRSLEQPSMNSIVVVVVHAFAEKLPQMALVNHDLVIEKISFDRCLFFLFVRKGSASSWWSINRTDREAGLQQPNLNGRTGQ